MSNACSWQPSTVRLVDGSEVLSDSAAWRFECEARYILGLPNKEERRKLLDLIEKRRGAEARTALEQKIMELWRAGQAAGGRAA